MRGGAGKPWTEPELDVVRKQYRKRGPRGCAELLPDRTESAITNRARALGLQRTKRLWSTGEISLLSREYPIGGLAGCVAVLRRSEQAIYQQAHNLGLSAPPYPSLKKAVGAAAVLRQEIHALRERLASAEARGLSERRRADRLELELSFRPPARVAA